MVSSLGPPPPSLTRHFTFPVTDTSDLRGETVDGRSRGVKGVEVHSIVTGSREGRDRRVFGDFASVPIDSVPTFSPVEGFHPSLSSFALFLVGRYPILVPGSPFTKSHKV